MARRIGARWLYDPETYQLKAETEVGRFQPIAYLTSPSHVHAKWPGGCIHATGHLMAKTPELAETLADLANAAGPLLGDAHPSMMRAQELISAIVAERLK